MIIVRPIKQSDLNDLHRIAVESGHGFTSLPVNEQLLKQRVQVLPGQQVFKFPFRITDPHLWWPSREGEPYLYNVNVIAEGESTRDQLLWKGGIRTIQLEQTPDSLGTPFTFIVNGHPVFAAGAKVV